MKKKKLITTARIKTPKEMIIAHHAELKLNGKIVVNSLRRKTRIARDIESNAHVALEYLI